MYAPMEIEGNPYYIKPMNCPFHIAIFRSRLRSYRELPIRWAELGTVYRHERSGQLHGLLRVRGFTQDDTHLFMRPDQLSGEIRRMLQFCLSLLGSFGFTDLEIRLSTRPEKYIGSLEIWDHAERCPECGDWIAGGTQSRHPESAAVRRRMFIVIAVIVLVGFLGLYGLLRIL